jgi:hypothetical protein
MKYAPVLLRLLSQTKQDIVTLARRNRRSTTEELRIAIDNHLEANAKLLKKAGDEVAS